jgi:hypothetical protein
MGYMAHDAVLVTINGYVRRGGGEITMPDVDAFRETLPVKWRPLVIGPVQSVTNDYWSCAFLPDGSKEGWRDSDLGDEYRRQFADLFSAGYEDGSSPFSVAMVRFGGDEPELAAITPVRPVRPVTPASRR